MGQRQCQTCSHTSYAYTYCQQCVDDIITNAPIRHFRGPEEEDFPSRTGQLISTTVPSPPRPGREAKPGPQMA